jgi:hypothetical protein
MHLPGAAQPTMHRLLHADPGQAQAHAVRFPPNWTRTGGRYSVAEEIVVLRGDLLIGGVQLSSGEYGWVPASAHRSHSEVGAAGCLAVAWFAGAPRWEARIEPAVETMTLRPVPAASVERRDAAGVVLCRGHSPGALLELTGPRSEILYLERGIWSWTSTGDSTRRASGTVMTRVWP